MSFIYLDKINLIEYLHCGLYDPVLDDSEYIYVPFEPDNLDQETNIDQLKETQFRSEELIDKTESTTDFAIHVPETVIHPTLLKLNYKDVFPELNVEELPPEIKYRLPISEQYDPEGKRVTMFHEYNKYSFVDVEEHLAKEHERNKGFFAENETRDRNVFKIQKLGANDCNYFQRNKDKIDLSQIEETASYVVDKNLNRAVSAANKLIKEIGTKSYEQSIQTEQTYKKHFYEDTKISGAENSITETEKKYKTETLSTKEIQKEVSVAEEIKKFESLDVRMDSKLNIEERKLLRQQDIEEAIEAGTVRQRTEIFKKEPGNKKFLENETFKIGAYDEYTSNIQLSKQRAYNLGLQLIPPLRKAAQLSKHGQFLFKIFLMQLTKVMIAISRFVLLDNNKYLHEYSDSFINRGEVIKKAKLSGAKIAQIEGFKPAELTNKMDIVLSEFLKKCGREEKYFEKIALSSQSRSRSNSKSKGEISNGFSFEPKTISHKKETLQETYKTKKNSIEIRELKSEKRYSDFRSLKMDSNINLYENEIKPVDDGNLIYIAIVEAHVYTNKDAIFGEQLRRMSENRYESESCLDKVFYRCEVSVTYRDFRESSLPPTVIIESIEEIPSEQLYEEEKQESQETSLLGFEEIAKKLAVQKITEVLEPLLMIKEVKSVNIKHAYPAIEMPLKTTTETTTLAMEKENNIFQRTLLSEKLHSSIEQPVKSVVETSVLSVQEDESGLIDIFEFTQQKPQLTIESTAKFIAETAEFIEGEKVETIDCIQQVLRTPHPVVEGSVKSVAEVTKIITDETKTNILNISKPVSVLPQYTITNNLKSVAETITTEEEAETDILNISKCMSLTPRFAISNNLLSIAETFTATTEEPKHENLDIAKLSKKEVGVRIDKNFATEVVEFFSEEPVPEKIVKLEIKERHGSEFFEKPLFLLPETNTVLTEEPMSESHTVPEPLMKEAKINTKLRDFSKCAEVTEIILNEKEQNTLDVMSSLENEPLESKEKPVLSVVATATVLPFEPKEEPLKIDKMKIQDARIIIQESQATEIAIVCSEEPQEENLNICKVNRKWPKIIIESSMLPVAEKLSVSLQELDHEGLIIPNFDMKSSQKIIQDTGLPVAENLLVVPNGPESVDIIVRNTTNEQAKIILEESKAPTTSVVYLEEPKSENLELLIVEEKEPRFSIQNCTLTIVTKEEVMPESPNYDDLKPFKYEKDVGKFDIEECTAILTTTTSYEEPKHENLEISRISEKQFKPLIETSLLTVAKTSTVVPESYNDSFDSEVTDEKATVKFVEIQNCETSEIIALETKEKYFEVPIVKQQSLVTNMEEICLSTAESLLVIPEITTNTFDVRKTDEEQPNIGVVENKNIETILVHPLEPNYEKLEIYTLANKQPETLIERPVLIVAETVTAVPEELCNNIFEMKTVEEKAMINRVLFENYTIAETTAEETIKRHEEIPVIFPQRPQTDIQRVHLLSAETLITIPETYFNSFETSKVENHQANINIIEQKGIESTLVCPFEAYYDELGISTVLKNQPETSVETPLLTVAENSMDVTAESYDSFATKISDEKATVNFVEIQNCGITEITIEEPKENNFEVPIVKQQSLFTSIEEVHLSTAESSLIIPEITTKMFDAKIIDKEQVKIDVVENKSIETLLVSPLEPNYEKLEISTVAKKQPETLIERPILVVAETATAMAEELYTNKLETKIDEDKAMVNRLLLESCITTETTVEEPINEHVEAPVITHQRLQTDIQRVHLSSAESSIIIPETSINSFETSKIESHQANINIVEQKGIEASLVCPVEPYYVELEIATVPRNQHDALVETPILTVAETSMHVTAESYDDSFATKISVDKATVNFVEMQNCESTEITVEEPKEKHFEVPLIKQQSLVTSMEQNLLSTAESSLIIPEITTNSFNARKTESYQAQKIIVEQKAIESTLVCPLEPYNDELGISTVLKNLPDALVETPVLTVAEASTVATAESCNDSYKTKITVEKATVNITTMQNRETTETFIEEPKENHLERTIIARQSLEPSTEETHLITAESLLIIPGIDINTFNESKSESQKVHVDIVEQKGIASFYVFPWEPHCDEIEIPKIIKKQVNSYIEQPLLIVAETITVVPLGNCDDKFDSRIRDEQALVHIVAHQNYIVTETIAEGPKENNFEILLVMDQQKLKTYIEELFLSVAEISTIIPEVSTTYFNVDKTEMQQIHVNMVEQKSIQTFLIFPFEPNIKNLAITKETANTPETLIDTSFLNVAEIFRAISEEPRYESFETKVTDVLATVNIIAIKTYNTTEITPEEPKEETLEISANNSLRLQTKIEDLNLSVAELIFIVPEISVHTFETKKTKSQQVHVNVIEQKSIEIFVQCLWEAYYEDLKISKASSIQPDISLQSPVLIVAEILTTILEGPHIDNFEIKIVYEQAEVNIVAIRLPGNSQIIAEEPKEMNFEIPTINKLKLQVVLEEVYLSLAESFLVLPDELVHNFKSRKMESQSVLVDVMEHKAIAIFFVYVLEPSYEDFEVQEIIKKVAHTFIVSSILTVAENLTFVFEEKVQEGFKTIKTSAYHVTTNFVKLKAAVKHVVFSEEPRQEIFERPKLFMVEPQLSVVDKYLTVAEIQIILPIEPKEIIFEKTEIITQYAHCEIEECKTAVSSMIFIEESNIEEFIAKGLITTESENLVEIIVKLIPQVTVINICEKEIEFSVPSQAVSKKVNIGFEALKPVAEKFLIFSEDSKHDVSECSKFISYHAKTTVIEAAATAVAQTTIVNVAKHNLQKSTKSIERKNEVDISEIIDISHDVKNVDSVDITKYNVELPKDYEESFTTQQEKDIFSRDIDFASLSSVSTSSSISSAPSSPLIEVYVFGVKGHEYRVQSPQETSLDVISTHVDTGYKIENMDTSMTIAIEASIDKFHDMNIEREDVYDINVREREFLIPDMEIDESIESADVHMNKINSNMSVETEHNAFTSAKYHSFKDLDTRSASIIKNRALSYDQAADFEVGLQSTALKSIETESSNKDSQELATFDFHSNAAFQSAKDIQSTEANLNIKMKSSKTMTAENIDVTYGLTIGNEIIDFDKSMDLSLQISHDSNTASTYKRQVKKGASKQISLENSQLLSLEKTASVKESYANHEEEMKAIYGIDYISTEKGKSGSETSFSAIKGNIESQSMLLEKSIRSIEMDASAQANFIDIETKISNDAQSPSPPVPSTPLTDYYMFKLQSPYPEENTFVPRDCSFTPESVDEVSLVTIDGLIPHIDTKIERILYSPPLQTPDISPERQIEVDLTESKVKDGAQGYRKEEIRDIGRKSLLASEIDKTIRSIEENTESVGTSAKKIEETKRLDNLGIQKVELSEGRQYMQATNASHVKLSIADANETFKGTSETKVKGLKRKTVTHKGLATSISGEKSVAETHQSRTSSSQSGSVHSSGIKSISSKSSSIQSGSIQSSAIESSGSKSTSIQSASIQSSAIESSSSKSRSRQLNERKSSSIQSSSGQSSSNRSGSVQLSGVQSSAIQSSNIQMSDTQLSGIKSSSSKQLSGIISNSIQSSSGQSSNIQSIGIQLSGIQSSDAKSSSNQSSGIQSSAIQSSVISSSIQSSSIQSSDIKSSAIQSSGIQSSGIKSGTSKLKRSQSSSIKSGSSKLASSQSSSIKSSGIQASSTHSSDIQSSGIKSDNSKLASSQSTSIKSSGIQASGTLSSSTQSSDIQSSGIKSGNSKLASSQSSSIKSSGIQASSTHSSDIQSSGIKSGSSKLASSQSSSIKSSGIQASGTLSSSTQSSDIQSSGITSGSSKLTSSQSSSIKSSDIQASSTLSSSTQSSGIQSSDIRSSNIQISGIKSSAIQSSNIQSSGIKSRTIQSSDIQSNSSKQLSGVKSHSIQSSDIQSSGNKSSSGKSSSSQSSSIVSNSSKSSSTKSDQKLHILSRFS